MKRRRFLETMALGSAGLTAMSACNSNNQDFERALLLDEECNRPVLKRDIFRSPLIIESLDLLRYGNNFLCRVRSKCGAEGMSVSNNMQMVSLYPIFFERLQPFFKGKDMRNLESLINEVYVYRSNYKFQNLALWVPLTTIELAILDLLGRVSGKSIGELIGEIHHTEVAVYQANNYRGRSAEESVELIMKDVKETGAKALKYKIGGRMSNNADYPSGRTEKLIPLIRKVFGDEMVVYADSNGSYTVDEAIRIGRILEEYKTDFYEEPVPFDWYMETKEVADNLSIPVAGGEQEASMRQFRWLIMSNALQIVQPDIFYFGGMIRSTRVARMAAVYGKECTPHISGSGLGYLYMLHFVSTLPNAGPFHEFKGFSPDIPLECKTSPLTSNEGIVAAPSGPGSGVDLEPGFVRKHKLMTG